MATNGNYRRAMKTDQLIESLVADLKPVDSGRSSRALFIALLVGAAGAFGAMLLVLAPRPEVFDSKNLEFLSIKLLFTLSTVATAAAFLPRLARPGADGHWFAVLGCLPFVAIATLAAAALASTQSNSWPGVLVAEGWLTCLFSIPVFAIAPFAAVICGLRTGAPTDLAGAGTAAGLAAGGLSATACSLACADDSLPSIALWYGLTTAICAGLGSKLGPRLLRW
jgi:hypothetical protein